MKSESARLREIRKQYEVKPKDITKHRGTTVCEKIERQLENEK